jgi:hypothetical protein
MTKLRMIAVIMLWPPLALLGLSPMAYTDETAVVNGALRAGFAERDITPEIGMEAPGGYGKAFHRSVHDPCKVRAAVFDDGQMCVALVGIDALGIRRDTVLTVRRLIHDKCGIATDAVLIGASHSHSSGPLVWIMPGEFDHASQLVQKLAYEESTTVDAKYLAHVEQAIVDAVCEAHARRAAALAGVGSGIENKVAFNRRFKMRSGRTVTHPGLGNPEIVEPAGPVDPEVGVLGVWDAREPGRLMGCIVNFACHATTSPNGASANYVYYLEKVIQGYFGKECVVVFLAGASGDVTQVDNRSEFQYPSGERWAQLVGGRVGAEAVKTLLSMHAGNLVPVMSHNKTWTIQRRVPNPERVRKAIELIEHDNSTIDATERTFAKETVLLDALLQKEAAAEVEVQVVQLGPAVFVSNPAEYFCQYGLEIKQQSGFPFTFPVSLANGCVGYVPTADAFGPQGGGYETRLTSYSNLIVTAGDEIRDAGIALSRQLKPGVVPEPPRRLPFTSRPWSYGNIAPEIE